jgi:hypothetical protein
VKLALLVMAVAAILVPSANAVPPNYEDVPPGSLGCGTLSTPDPSFSGSCTTPVLADAEPMQSYFGSVVGDSYYGNYTCRGKTGWITFRSIVGVDIWRYFEHVYWCWTPGAKIIYNYRTRWPLCLNPFGLGCLGWSFTKHVYNNCLGGVDDSNSHCMEKKGFNSSYTDSTAGQWHFKWGFGPATVEKDATPYISMTISAFGGVYVNAY